MYKHQSPQQQQREMKSEEKLHQDQNILAVCYCESGFSWAGGFFWELCERFSYKTWRLRRVYCTVEIIEIIHSGAGAIVQWFCLTQSSWGSIPGTRLVLKLGRVFAHKLIYVVVGRHLSLASLVSIWLLHDTCLPLCWSAGAEREPKMKTPLLVSFNLTTDNAITSAYLFLYFYKVICDDLLQTFNISMPVP